MVLRLGSGHNGSGKTLSLAKDAIQIIKEYPLIEVITNIEIKDIPQETKVTKYYTANELIEKLKELKEESNGYLIIIDEIHIVLADMFGRIDPIFLTFLSQQRKLSIKILATSQLFSRMLKPIREFIIQSGNVIVCKNVLKVIQINKYVDMESVKEDNKNGLQYTKAKLKWFIHTKEDYERYDTYAVISQIKGLMKGEKANGLSTYNQPNTDK